MNQKLPKTCVQHIKEASVIEAYWAGSRARRQIQQSNPRSECCQGLWASGWHLGLALPLLSCRHRPSTQSAVQASCVQQHRQRLKRRNAHHSMVCMRYRQQLSPLRRLGEQQDVVGIGHAVDKAAAKALQVDGAVTCVVHLQKHPRSLATAMHQHFKEAHSCAMPFGAVGLLSKPSCSSLAHKLQAKNKVDLVRAQL